MEQNQQQQFRCTGDCFKCQPLQRQYCAAQWSYNGLRIMEDMQKSLNAMQGTIEELKTKIEAIQGNEAALFDPTAKPVQAAVPAQPTPTPAPQAPKPTAQ